MQTKNSTPESVHSKKSLNNPRPSVQFSTAETKVSHKLHNNNEASVRQYTNSEEQIDTVGLIEDINQSQSQFLSFQALNKDLEKDLQHLIEQKISEHNQTIKNISESFDKKLQNQTQNLSNQFFQIQQNIQAQYQERIQSEKLQYESIEYNLKKLNDNQIRELEIQIQDLNEEFQQQIIFRVEHDFSYPDNIFIFILFFENKTTVNEHEEEKAFIQQDHEKKIYQIIKQNELRERQLKDQHQGEIESLTDTYQGELQTFREELYQKTQLIKEYENTIRSNDVRIRQLMNENQQINNNLQQVQNEIQQQKERNNFNQQEIRKLNEMHQQEISQLKQNFENQNLQHEHYLKIIKQSILNDFIPQEEYNNQMELMNKKQAQYEEFIQEKLKIDQDQYQNTIQKLQQENRNLNSQLKQCNEDVVNQLEIQKSLKEQLNELECNQIYEEDFYELQKQNEQLVQQIEKLQLETQNRKNGDPESLRLQIQDLNQKNNQLQFQLKDQKETKQQQFNPFQNIWPSNQSQEISIMALQDELKMRNCYNQEITKEIQLKNKIIEKLQNKVSILKEQIEKPTKELECILYKISNAVEMVKFIKSLKDKKEIERLSSDEDSKKKQDQHTKQWENQISYILEQFRQCKFDSVQTCDQQNSQFLILTQQFDEMKNQIKEIKNQNIVYENYIKNLKSNIGKLHEEKMKSEEKIADLEVKASVFQKNNPSRSSRDLFPNENSSPNLMKQYNSQGYFVHSQNTGRTSLNGKQQNKQIPKEISFQE